MRSPYIWVGLMFVLAILSFSATGGVTVFSAGFLTVPLVIIALLITAIPTLILMSLDVRATSKGGADWGKERYAIYVAALPTPAWIIIPIYLLVRLSK